MRNHTTRSPQLCFAGVFNTIYRLALETRQFYVHKLEHDCATSGVFCTIHETRMKSTGLVSTT